VKGKGINVDDWGLVCNGFGVPETSPDICDDNEDGYISESEFASCFFSMEPAALALSKAVNEKYGSPAEGFAACCDFPGVDVVDGKGINADNWGQVCKGLGVPETTPDLCDGSGDGYISESEFASCFSFAGKDTGAGLGAHLGVGIGAGLGGHNGLGAGVGAGLGVHAGAGMGADVGGYGPDYGGYGTDSGVYGQFGTNAGAGLGAGLGGHPGFGAGLGVEPATLALSKAMNGKYGSPAECFAACCDFPGVDAVDGKGISVDDWGQVCKGFSMPETSPDICDGNEDGYISESEFASCFFVMEPTAIALSKRMNDKYKSPDEAFDACSKFPGVDVVHGKGIRADDWGLVCKGLGVTKTSANLCDGNKNGYISNAELAACFSLAGAGAALGVGPGGHGGLGVDFGKRRKRKHGRDVTRRDLALAKAMNEKYDNAADCYAAIRDFPGVKIVRHKGIPADDWGRVCKRLGVKEVSPKICDRNGNGYISKSELASCYSLVEPATLALASAMNKKYDSPTKCFAACRHFPGVDIVGRKGIDANDWGRVCKGLGVPETSPGLLDYNEDGYISKKEFGLCFSLADSQASAGHHVSIHKHMDVGAGQGDSGKHTKAPSQPLSANCSSFQCPRGYVPAGMGLQCVGMKCETSVDLDTCCKQEKCCKEHPEGCNDVKNLFDNPQKRIILIGWEGCECTGMARKRFQSLDLCYEELTFKKPNDSKMKYMMCQYGQEHHSFIFMRSSTDANAEWKFEKNGFYFHEKKMSTATLQSKIGDAGAQKTCPAPSGKGEAS